jgi:hypothetical protein
MQPTEEHALDTGIATAKFLVMVDSDRGSRSTDSSPLV